VIATDIEVSSDHGRWEIRVVVESECLPNGRFSLQYAVTGVTDPPDGTVGDAVTAGLLLPAMAFGEELVIDAPVSARLLERTPKIMDIYAAWAGTIQPVSIHATAQVREKHATGTGQFFSGGVDSFYSLIKRRKDTRPPEDDRLSHLLFLDGFDIPLGNPSQPKALEAVRRVAEGSGLGLATIRTNLRSLAEPHIDWGLYHGAVLASAGLLVGNSLHRCVIPSSQSYQFLTPWGSHPLLDPLWSTETLEFVHDGCEVTRHEKVAVVGDDALAQRELRVCLQSINGLDVFNCGRCRKCMWTMLALRLHGRLDGVVTFPAFDPSHLDKLSIKEIDSFAHLVDLARDRDMERALYEARRRRSRHDRRERLGRRVGATLHRVGPRRRPARVGTGDAGPVGGTTAARTQPIQIRWKTSIVPAADDTSDSTDPDNVFLRQPPPVLTTGGGSSP